METENQMKWKLLKKTVLDNPYIKQVPTIKQAEFLTNTKPEVLFGGAIGGGKSSGLLMGALQWVEFEHYGAIILRTTYKSLTLNEGLIPRSHEWLDDTDAIWHDQSSNWEFPSGSTLTFGYLEHPNDIYRYKSASFNFIGFEELTEFPREYDYNYLFTRKRRLTGSFLPSITRSTSNPDGIGAGWVFERFQPEDPTKRDPTRDFIMSLMDDNPHLDQADYEKTLKTLDPITYQQLRHGKWRVAKDGNKFRRSDLNQFIESDELPAGRKTVRFWDLAATEAEPGKDPDWTVGARVSGFNGQYYIEDIQRLQGSPGRVEERIKDIAKTDGKSISIYMEQEPGASGKIVIDDYARRVLVGYPFRGDKPTGNKEVRANVFSSAAFNKNVFIVRGSWNFNFVEECVAFPTKGFHDDQVDATSGAISKLMTLGNGTPINFSNLYELVGKNEDEEIEY